MHDKMKKLMEKKKSKGLSDSHIKAKSSVLNDISSIAGKMMKEKLGGLKKVTVASDSKQGMEEGLETAQDLLKKLPNGGSEDAESSEEPEMMAEEGEEAEEGGEESSEEEQSAGPSKEELLAEIEKLKAKVENMV